MAPSPQPVLSVSLLIVVIAVILNFAFNRYNPINPSLLRQLAKDQFAWGSSTTPIPISSVSVLAKSLLSKDIQALPTQLHSLIPTDDTLQIQQVREYTNQLRLHRIRKFCSKVKCNFQETDPQFGFTPLHLAAFSGDEQLQQYLEQNGAVSVEDHAGRKPANLSFANFIANSKKWARQAGRECDFPVVNYDGSDYAKSEVRRLVNEGEPVLMRGAYTHYDPASKQWDVKEMVDKFGDTRVTVGHVPYAAAFNLSITGMTLAEYYERFVVPASDQPLYVFNKGAHICQDGYQALVKLVQEAFPTPNLIAHPDETGGLDGIHFFFGKSGSGAPFHIHADAVNAAVNGRKKWFAYTPSKTLYSRKTIKKWVEEDLEEMDEDAKPLQCVQHPGDVVYVPLDWGHAVLNMDENTFGFALELLNRRDTLSHLWRN